MNLLTYLLTYLMWKTATIYSTVTRIVSLHYNLEEGKQMRGIVQANYVLYSKADLLIEHQQTAAVGPHTL